MAERAGHRARHRSGGTPPAGVAPGVPLGGAVPPAGAAGARTRGSKGGQARELAVVAAIAEALNSATDVRQALERTLALVAERLGLRTGWVWLLDPETDQFYSAAVQHLPPYLQEPVRMTGRWCECIGAFREGTLAPKNVDVIECSRLRPAVRGEDTALTQGLRYHASIPLYFRDRPLGIMNVTGPSWRKLTRDELRLLSTVANQVGIAVERARLAEERTRLARTEERARIAREIHDTLAQGLTAIGLHVESALRALDGDPQRARERLQRALAASRESLEEARRSVFDLRAGPPAGRPLADALAALARAFTADTGVRTHIRPAPPAEEPPDLPLRVEAELFRIAQEALANVRQHARAREVEIALRRGRRALRLSIRDDGVGFAAAGAAPGGAAAGDRGGRGDQNDAGQGGGSGGRGGSHRGHGIEGMRERARLLGGSLRVASRPGEGTVVVATVPLPPAGAAGEPA